MGPKKDSSPQNMQQEATIHRLMAQLALQNGLAVEKSIQHIKDHKFWKTQPVPQTSEEVAHPPENGPIEPVVHKETLRQDPLPLPKEFEWVDVDVEHENQLKELYELLSNNYVEDDDAMFRFAYSAEFLKWALKPPGWKKVWHVGVRVVANKKLVAFISGVPSIIRSYTHSKDMVVIDFLCVHKKLRSKRLAPVLIKEVTRRCNLEGIFQALYTAGVVLPGSLAKCRYYHRNLNPRKLVDIGFSQMSPGMTMQRMERLYRVPGAPLIPGIRPMTSADVSTVHEGLNSYLMRYRLAPVFTREEVQHWFLPIEGVVYSYVVEDPSTSQITDFFSFYYIPSAIMNHPTQKILNVAYIFYYFVRYDPNKNLQHETSKEDKERLKMLTKDALIYAKQNGADVMNCLMLMDNESFLKDLKFGPGDGYLNYYLYNWRCKAFETNEVGCVLL